MKRNQIMEIYLKTVVSSVPTVPFFDNGDAITNPYDIAVMYGVAFNNYFASIAETMKKA